MLQVCNAETRGQEMRADAVAAPFVWAECQRKKGRKRFPSACWQATQRPVREPGCEVAWVPDEVWTSQPARPGFAIGAQLIERWDE